MADAADAADGAGAARAASAAGGPVIDIVARLVAEVCAVDRASVKSHSRLLAFGLDSVRLLDLLLVIEERFGLELGESDPELGAIDTVGDLAALIERRRAGAPEPGG